LKGGKECRERASKKTNELGREIEGKKTERKKEKATHVSVCEFCERVHATTAVNDPLLKLGNSNQLQCTGM